MSIFKIMQIAGAALLVAALVLTWLHLTLPTVIALVAVVGLDIALVLLDEDTVSVWIHRQFPNWADISIMIGLCVFTWLLWGLAGFVPILIGVIMGHLFWHE